MCCSASTRMPIALPLQTMLLLEQELRSSLVFWPISLAVKQGTKFMFDLLSMPGSKQNSAKRDASIVSTASETLWHAGPQVLDGLGQPLQGSEVTLKMTQLPG